MYAWKLLEEKEIEYEEAKRQLQALQNRNQKFDDTVTEHQRELTSLKEQEEEKMKKYTDAEAVATADLGLVETANDEVKAFERQLKDKQKKVRQVDKESSKAKKERKRLENQIAELHGKGDSSAELEPLMAEKNELDESIVSAKQEHDTGNHEVFQLAKRGGHLDEVLSGAAQFQQQQKSHLQDLDWQLARLKGSSKNKALGWLSGEARQGTALMNAIAKERRFERPPVGPLGVHVQLRDASWGIAIENSIGSQFSTFVCDNNKDKNLLSGLLNKHGNGRTRIVVSKFGPRHKTDRPAPANQVITVEDQLIVDNDVAFNVLVDFARIESTVLCESRDEAQTLVKKNNKIGQVFLKKDGQSLKYSYGSLSFSPPNKKTCSLGENQEAAIAGIEREMQGAEEKLRDAVEQAQADKNERAELAAERKEITRTTLAAKKKYEGMRNRMAQIQARVNEIHSEIAEDDEMAGKIAAITEAIEEVEQQTKDFVQQREQCVEEWHGVEEERDSAIRRKEELYQRAVKKMEEEGVEVLGAEIEEIKSKIKQHEQYLRKLSTSTNHTERDLEAKKREVEDLQDGVVKAGLAPPKYAEKLGLNEYSTRPANLSSEKPSNALWKQITHLNERIKERQV